MHKDLFNGEQPDAEPDEETGDAAFDEVLAPMTKIWGKPRSVSDEDLALSFYREDLKDYDREVLRMAFQQVRREHVYQTWPASAAFIKAADSLRGVTANGSSDMDRSVLTCNRRATEYATQRFAGPEGLEAITGGYSKPWNEYIRREACQQLFRGLENPDVVIPPDVMAGFVEEGRVMLTRSSDTAGHRSLGSTAKALTAGPDELSDGARGEVRQDLQAREDKRRRSIQQAATEPQAKDDEIVF